MKKHQNQDGTKTMRPARRLVSKKRSTDKNKKVSVSKSKRLLIANNNSQKSLNFLEKGQT